MARSVGGGRHPIVGLGVTNIDGGGVGIQYLEQGFHEALTDMKLREVDIIP